MPAGTRFTLELPGGGGYFPPMERDSDAVELDVAEGMVTAEAAEREYGVVVSPDGRVTGTTAARTVQPGANS
jgi:N-methylhydantoinase B